MLDQNNNLIQETTEQNTTPTLRAKPGLDIIDPGFNESDGGTEGSYVKPTCSFGGAGYLVFEGQKGPAAEVDDIYKAFFRCKGDEVFTQNSFDRYQYNNSPIITLSNPGKGYKKMVFKYDHPSTEDPFRSISGLAVGCYPTFGNRIYSRTTATGTDEYIPITWYEKGICIDGTNYDFQNPEVNADTKFRFVNMLLVGAGGGGGGGGGCLGAVTGDGTGGGAGGFVFATVKLDFSYAEYRLSIGKGGAGGKTYIPDFLPSGSDAMNKNGFGADGGDTVFSVRAFHSLSQDWNDALVAEGGSGGANEKSDNTTSPKGGGGTNTAEHEYVLKFGSGGRGGKVYSNNSSSGVGEQIVEMEPSSSAVQQLFESKGWTAKLTFPATSGGANGNINAPGGGGGSILANGPQGAGVGSDGKNGTLGAGGSGARYTIKLGSPSQTTQGGKGGDGVIYIWV